MSAWRQLGASLLLMVGTARALCGAAPAVFQTAPGRYEITATDAAHARVVADAAEEGWRLLSEPLALPAQFSSPVFVRVIDNAEWESAAAFRVVAEPGGIVSLRLPVRMLQPPAVLRRALTQALLIRVGVAQHGVTERLACPLWLELGCAAWWQTHADPAQGDALQQASRDEPGVPLASLFAAARGDAEPPALEHACAWLLVWLQTESTRGAEWRDFLRHVLGGEDATAALATSFPGRFANAAERELWWRTGLHHVRRVRMRPVLDSMESRRELETLVRFVVENEGGRDRVASLAEILAHASEPFLAAEIQRRARELARLVPALHPFFRNAGLSLADAFAAAAPSRPAPKIAAACEAFARDWSDALELAQATAAALDGLESRPRE